MGFLNLELGLSNGFGQFGKGLQFSQFLAEGFQFGGFRLANQLLAQSLIFSDNLLIIRHDGKLIKFSGLQHFFESLGALIGRFNVFLFLFSCLFGLLALKLEFFNSTHGVDKLHFTGKEGVALGTNVDMNFFQSRAGFKSCPARASGGNSMVFGVNVFHNWAIITRS